MFVPASVDVALPMMFLLWFCWGIWPSARKKGGSTTINFALTYVCFQVLSSFFLCFTLGMANPQNTMHFDARQFHAVFADELSENSPAVLIALLGGLLLCSGDFIMAKAIEVLGLSVACPIGFGTAMVFGTALSYFLDTGPKADARLLFPGLGACLLGNVCNAASAWDVSCIKKGSGNTRSKRQTSTLQLGGHDKANGGSEEGNPLDAGTYPVKSTSWLEPEAEDPSPEADEVPDETAWVWSPDADFWSPDLPSGPEPLKPIQQPSDNADSTESSVHNTDEAEESHTTEPQYVQVVSTVFESESSKYKRSLHKRSAAKWDLDELETHSAAAFLIPIAAGFFLGSPGPISTAAHMVGQLSPFSQLFCFMFGQLISIFPLVSVVTWVSFCHQRRQGRSILTVPCAVLRGYATACSERPKAVLCDAFAGCCVGTGQFLFLVGSPVVSKAVGFMFGTSSLLLSVLMGIVVFKELRGKNLVQKLLTAVAVICLVLALSLMCIASLGL
ncbi:UPS4 [Symbiodinium sp. CCMP2592]|nr:UPS4 [Symbiodinium sp. CCMP2592]